MIREITAIDVHTHINTGSKFDTKVSEFNKADLDSLVMINEAANVKKMFASPYCAVLSKEEVVEGNEYMYNLSLEKENLYQWVVIDPRNDETFLQAKKMLQSPKCVGIKLHPPFHDYTLEEFGDKIFSFASDFGAVVQIHPERDADYVLPFADKYADVKFMMAHHGSFDGTGYARAIANCKHDNVYTDTSGKASYFNYILEYTVNRVGSERILFGTDTYAPGFQRGRIEMALISEKDKENILVNNAKRLFGM